MELGTCVFGHRDPDTGPMIFPRLEMVRLAIPRRVYTDRHMDMVAEAFRQIDQRRHVIKGLQLVYVAPVLRHFTARFVPLSS